MELRSRKALVKGDQKEDSDNDPEEDVHSLLEGYAVGGHDEEEVIARRRMDLVERPPAPQPPHPLCNGHLQCPLSTDVSDA